MNDRDDTAELPAPLHETEPRAPRGESARVEVDLGALSHPGKVRKQNEDHFIATRFERSMRTLASNLPPGEVPAGYAETAFGYLVADGVGGSVAGELASRTAVHAIMDLVLETPDWIMRLDRD